MEDINVTFTIQLGWELFPRVLSFRDGMNRGHRKGREGMCTDRLVHYKYGETEGEGGGSTTDR